MNNQDPKVPAVKSSVLKEKKDMEKRLERDFVVKNMPSLASFSSLSYENGEKVKTKYRGQKKASASSTSSEDKSRSIGLLIIVGGFVIIVALGFAVYYFLIAPSLPNNKSQNQAPAVQNNPVAENNNLADNKVTPIKADNISQNTASSTSTSSPEIDLGLASSSTTVASSSEMQASSSAFVLPSHKDSDGDYLSDEAEVLLGTDPNNVDTDGDSYPDRKEILNGYNPKGPGNLSDDQLAIYKDPENLFAVVYPQSWQASQVSSSSTLFSAPDNSMVQIAYEDSGQDNSDILAWYKSQFDDANQLDSTRVIDSDMGVGLISTDGQTAYFLAPDHRHIYVVSYIKAGQSSDQEKAFKLMATTIMIP